MSKLSQFFGNKKEENSILESIQEKVDFNNTDMKVLNDEEIGLAAGGRMVDSSSKKIRDKKYCSKCGKKVYYTSYSGGRDLCDICRTPVS